MPLRRIAAIALLVLATLARPLTAEVVRIDVQSRADLVNGKAFGSAGPYEKLAGRVYFEIDPLNSANAIITDIAKAPRNARGRVEFSADFFLIKPKDIARGNGTVFYEDSRCCGSAGSSTCRSAPAWCVSTRRSPPTTAIRSSASSAAK
jgi:hypothetical protein